MTSSEQAWIPTRVADGVCSESANEDLRRRIVNSLHARGVSDVDSLVVESNDGLVVIRGRLPSFQAKRQCVDCCRHVAGVLKLVEELEVPWQPTNH